jgi:integrase
VARSVNRLTFTAVKNIKGEGDYADGNNLYLRVSSSGTKSWTLVYSFRGKRRELGLGSFTVVSLADARRKAEEAARLRHEGVDPKLAWSRSATSTSMLTFGELALEHIENQSPIWRNEKHTSQWRNTLRTYAAPIWEWPVDAITTQDVYDILRPIWSSKAETAKRVRGRIEAVLDAAKARGLRSGENPAAWRGNLAHLLPPRRKGSQKHHPAMPFADVADFMVRLREGKSLSARALEFTILTAARTGETVGARWTEIDLDKGIWTISAKRMKAGKEHRVALPTAAVELLRSLPRHGEFIFPGLKRGTHLSNMAMENVLRRMKVKPFTVHGFRSSFRDWSAEETDFPRELAELALAHAVGSEVERAYRRGDGLERRRQLMEAWAAYVAAPSDPTINPTIVAE